MINLSLVGSDCYSGAGHNIPDADDPSPSDGLFTDVPLPDAAWLKEMSDLFPSDAAPAQVPVMAVNERVEVEEVAAWSEQLQGEKKKRRAKETVGTRGCKRQRSPLGPIETASAWNEAMYDQVLPVATGMKVDGGARARPPRKKEDRGSVPWEWDTAVGLPGYPAAAFWLLFHMFPSTFDSLCKLLAPVVGWDETKPRRRQHEPVPVRKRVAVAVWHLASGEPLREIKKRFNIALSTCQKIVRQVCAAIKDVVFPLAVGWPDAARMAASAAKFKALSGIQGIAGAVYTTHVSIIAPPNNAIGYYNRHATARNNGRDSYSVTLQASMDADGTFTNVFAGQPGGMSDEETLLGSSLNKPDRAGEILAQGMRLVGGASYPLLDWTLVPYSGQNLKMTQQRFNEGVAMVRDVAVNGFRRFKARWGCLQKRSEVKLEVLETELYACCALHNLCERSGDPLHPELLPGLELHDDDAMVAIVHSTAAAQARDALAHDMMEQLEQRTSQPGS
ncbi:hypothetical protein D1007_16953 [Hordeum vulgare]|nr:hypothetical protein D1007_16953 [Hordeum vulgare]